jgi:CubicO group peptidase (beta-lactamase class C family)
LNDYVPAPSPAHSDRIVAAHYYAAWKYGAAGLHEGFNDLAKDYPERTPLMGYYDEENPEVSDWEIKWAVEHGINCFIYCWYRKPENVGKTVTVESLRCPHGIHEALLRARYRKHMKFALMLQNGGEYNGHRILSAASVEEIATPQLSIEANPGAEPWGLSVRVIRGEEYPYLPAGTFGWSGAYGTHFWVDPVNRITAVYMKNSKYDGGSGATTAVRFEEDVYTSLV